MNPIYRKAITKADEIRHNLRLDMFEPLNIFDACDKMGVIVRFVDVNMEGVYVKGTAGNNPTILLSHQRPLPRRCYTCAHEFGHHLFGHGSKIDPLTNEEAAAPSTDQEELLVDSFAGTLLMPTAGVLSEFAKRGWQAATASPVQFYNISSIFGTGYSSLVTHCVVNRIIDHAKAGELLKHTPAKILKSIYPKIETVSHFKLFDTLTTTATIDLEVFNYIFLPSSVNIEGDHFSKCHTTRHGTAYIAVKPGVVRASNSDQSISYFIRIQRAGYVGLAEFRHLETEAE